MNFPYRPVALAAAVLAFSAVVVQRAQAGGGHYYPPASEPAVKEECGACHLPFAPAMLPAKSWQAMMGDLGNHFGDDASLDAATADRITRYLVTNAADAAGRPYSGKLLAGVSPDNPPLRITELPAWVREHRSVSDWEWRQKDVGTRANCLACHADAARGYYDE